MQIHEISQLSSKKNFEKQKRIDEKLSEKILR